MAAKDIRHLNAVQELQAMLSSIGPDVDMNGRLTAEQIQQLSNKLAELGILDGLPQASGEQLNDEGLPIVDISEPLDARGSSEERARTENAIFHDKELIPLDSLSPSERARLKAQRDRILDALEEEERESQFSKSRADLRREEIDKLREAAKKEGQRLRAATEVQKRMGKALLRDMARSRDKEEKTTQSQNGPPQRVTFAEPPSETKSSEERKDQWGAEGSVTRPDARIPGKASRESSTLKDQSLTARQTMKTQVIERRPPKPPQPQDASSKDTDRKPSRFLMNRTGFIHGYSMQYTTILAILVRLSIALLTRTFFQPDEYFQSLEPAHHLVFGYGKLTWEWVTPRPVRSIVYPALNVPIYWMLKVTGLDSTDLLITGPRVLHGSLAAITDIWVGELALRVIGERYAPVAMFISLTSFFHALALSRSFSNSLETSLTTLAVSRYPWDPSVLDSKRLRSDVRTTLLIAAGACVARPTNAILWVYLFLALIWRLRSHRALVFKILLDAAWIGALAIFLLFAVDSIYFGAPTFTPLNFLLTNMSAVSLFYGSNSWHYYITQGLPILCATALPFVLHGFWLGAWHGSGGTPFRVLLGCIYWTTFVYSLAGHKEWRFLHPLLPMLHVVAAKSLVDLTNGTHATSRREGRDFSAADQPEGGGAVVKASPSVTLSRSRIRTSHVIILLLSLPVSFGVVLLYRDGPIGAIQYLRSLPAVELREGSVGFLMPCHSTPWQAYLHREELKDEGRLWALGCEPPLDHPDLISYRDQTDVFYESPSAYLRRYFPPFVNVTFPPSPYPCSRPGAAGKSVVGWAHEWPRFLVMFGVLLEEPGVQELLWDKGYEEVWVGGLTLGEEKRTSGGVKVLKHHSPTEVQQSHT